MNRFWALLIAMAYIALAPALKNPPIGIVLAGNDGPNLAAAICATFGCQEWKTPRRIDARKPYDQFNRALAQTHWPVVVRPQVKSLPAVCHVLAGLDPANCFIPVADILAAPPARTAGWHVIHAEDAQATIELLERYGADVLIHYLRHVMSLRLGSCSRGKGPLDSIRSELAEWFSAGARGRPAVLGADSVLWRPTNARGDPTSSGPRAGSQSSLDQAFDREFCALEGLPETA